VTQSATPIYGYAADKAVLIQRLHRIEGQVRGIEKQGPAMTDAIHSIDASALNAPACSAYTYMLRSYDPFLRAPFDQFARRAPAPTPASTSRPASADSCRSSSTDTPACGSPQRQSSSTPASRRSCPA
jgi:hypothetical protein